MMAAKGAAAMFSDHGARLEIIDSVGCGSPACTPGAPCRMDVTEQMLALCNGIPAEERFRILDEPVHFSCEQFEEDFNRL